jgi:polysaccharide export outer membrane protein
VFYRKIAIFTLILGIAGFIFSSQALTNRASSQEYPEYIMGPGDLLEIAVWNHPELVKTMRIRPDGKVSFPLIKNIHAAGNTPSALMHEMEKRLAKYLKEPKVSVIIMEYKSKNVLVLGEVKTPGLYQYEGDMSAFDAIAKAGGYNKHAQLNSILVIESARSSEPKFFIADLHKAVRYGDITQDVRLRPNDLVYVPKNFIGNIGDAMDFFFARIQPVATTYFLVNETD